MNPQQTVIYGAKLTLLFQWLCEIVWEHFIGTSNSLCKIRNMKQQRPTKAGRETMEELKVAFKPRFLIARRAETLELVRIAAAT